MAEDALDRPARRTSSAAPGVRFVVSAVVLSVTLFGVLRIPFVEQHLLLPFTQAQHGLACRIGGNPDAPIVVGLSCSAADVIALCMGFILAFPVPIRRRLIGAGLGLVTIAAVNTVRIATLSHAVRNRQWFDLLHVYIWPGALLVVVSVFVFLWMNHSLRATSGRDRAAARFSPRSLLTGTAGRFGLLTVLFVAVFVGTSSWWMHSQAVRTVATWVAATGAGVIRLFGGEVSRVDNVLRTANGSFIVTQECIMTPLIPAYFAATFALPMARRKRMILLFAALPLFFVLGAARLLVLAFPSEMVGSHLMAIHGFYQLLLGALLVALAARYSPAGSRDTKKVMQRTLSGLGVGAVVFFVLMTTYTPLLFEASAGLQARIGHPGHTYMDPQSALLLLAPYQLSLFLALWLVWSWRQWGGTKRRAMAGLAALIVLQPVVLVAIGEWVTHTGLEPHEAAIRAGSVLMILAIAAWTGRLLSKWRSQDRVQSLEVEHG